MKRECSNISRNVANLDADGRRWLERLLGRSLDDDERVFVMTTHIPDEATRHAARQRLRQIWAEIDNQVKKQGISGEEIEATVDEASEHVRRRQDH